MKEKDVTLEERVAAGAEGEVWRGRLQGRAESVAVKLCSGIGAAQSVGKPVWHAAEVSAMMSMQHPRLVGTSSVADGVSEWFMFARVHRCGGNDRSQDTRFGFIHRSGICQWWQYGCSVLGDTV